MAHHHPNNLTTTPTTPSPHALFLTAQFCSRLFVLVGLISLLTTVFCIQYIFFILDDTNLHQIQFLLFCSFLDIWRFSHSCVRSKIRFGQVLKRVVEVKNFSEFSKKRSTNQKRDHLLEVFGAIRASEFMSFQSHCGGDLLSAEYICLWG